MKKIIYIFLAFTTTIFLLCACNSQVDYYGYVSELRSNIFIYKDDNYDCKIYISNKETPYNSDGIKGEMNSIIEVFLTLPTTPNKVEIELGIYSGEMNYQAVSNSFYLSFSGEGFKDDNVEVKLLIDGNEKIFEAVSVLYDGIITPQSALDCVYEYDTQTFESLTNGNFFNGEIYIRLLYDKSCYYYVGICDKTGKINAYLLDAETSHIIAQRTT
jgi:hypothetical protein